MQNIILPETYCQMVFGIDVLYNDVKLGHYISFFF